MEIISDQLKRLFSPDQISAPIDVSHETIYNHIYADKARGGELWCYLRCQEKHCKRYRNRLNRRGQIIGRRAISEQPSHFEARFQIEPWKGDALMGRTISTLFWASLSVKRATPFGPRPIARRQT